MARFMLLTLKCTYITSSCMSLTRGCKPDLLPDIFDLSIIWHSANHWYVRNVASDALERLVWEREVEGGDGVLLQRSAEQRSRLFALFQGSDNENVPVQLVSILRGFCTPNLIFGGARWRQWVTGYLVANI